MDKNMKQKIELYQQKEKDLIYKHKKLFNYWKGFSVFCFLVCIIISEYHLDQLSLNNSLIINFGLSVLAIIFFAIALFIIIISIKKENEINKEYVAIEKEIFNEEEIKFIKKWKV